MFGFFLIIFFGGGFGLKFAECESIDRDEIIDRMKVEQEAMTRALMIVSSLPSGSLLTVARSFYRMEVEQESMTRAWMVVKSSPSGSLLRVVRSLPGIFSG